jgi:hypothetical protein
MNARAKAIVIAAGLVGLSLLVSNAPAERIQKGNLIVALNGGISPRALPRLHRVPVAVRLSGRVQTSDGTPTPRVNWIKLELAWRGSLDTRGLAVCPKARLRSTEVHQAIRACGASRVGSGRLFAIVYLPNQTPIRIHTFLTAFNGRSKAGRPEVLIHAYSSQPPISFVIPFHVHHGSGAFSTVLVALIRRDAGPWPHVANFQIAISRNFRFHGERHSYLSASCPVPPGFTAGFLSFARATYTFAGGEQLVRDAVRSCRARVPRPH